MGQLSSYDCLALFDIVADDVIDTDSPRSIMAAWPGKPSGVIFWTGTRAGDRETAQGEAKPAAAEALQLRRRRGGVDRGRAQGGEENEVERQNAEKQDGRA